MTRLTYPITAMSTIFLQNHHKSKKISELEDGVSSVRTRRSSSGSSEPASDTLSTKMTSPTHMATARTTSAIVRPPGRDEYNKGTQTVETAFVPCANCDAVQSGLKTLADSTSTMCHSLGITSHLDKLRNRINSVPWLSG